MFPIHLKHLHYPAIKITFLLLKSQFVLLSRVKSYKILNKCIPLTCLESFIGITSNSLALSLYHFWKGVALFACFTPLMYSDFKESYLS